MKYRAIFVSVVATTIAFSSVAATKENLEPTESASVQLIAADKTFSLFSYKKEKITDEEAKALKYDERLKKDDVDFQKVDLDPKAIFEFLKKGGVLRVELKGIEPREFVFVPQKVLEFNFIGSYSQLQEDSGSASSDLSVSTNGVAVGISIRIRGKEFRVSSSKNGESHFIFQIDPSKRRPHHGLEYKPRIGGPPIEVPPEPTNNAVKPLFEPIPPINQAPSKKSVTASTNIYIGVMLTQSAWVDVN